MASKANGTFRARFGTFTHITKGANGTKVTAKCGYSVTRAIFAKMFIKPANGQANDICVNCARS